MFRYWRDFMWCLVLIPLHGSSISNAFTGDIINIQSQCGRGDTPRRLWSDGEQEHHHHHTSRCPVTGWREILAMNKICRQWLSLWHKRTDASHKPANVYASPLYHTSHGSKAGSRLAAGIGISESVNASLPVSLLLWTPRPGCPQCAWVLARSQSGWRVLIGWWRGRHFLTPRLLVGRCGNKIGSNDEFKCIFFAVFL